MRTSILISSRKNPIYLIDTINSYLHQCSSQNNIEILIALDNDDLTRFSIIDYFKNISSVKIFEMERVGYWRLNETMNFLASKSCGNILWMTTDKCIIKTKNWDELFIPYENKFIVGSCVTEWIESFDFMYYRGGILLPMVHRKWYEVLNKIGNDVHMDSGIGFTIEHFKEFGDFGKKLLNKICINFENLIVEMDRRKPSVVDKIGTSDFHSEKSCEERRKDAKKIFDFLQENAEYIP